MNATHGRAHYGVTLYGHITVRPTFAIYGKAHYGTTLYGLWYNIAFLRKRFYFQAKGQVGKLIIYRYNGSHGRQDVYDYVLGNNPMTYLQQLNRMKFKAAMQGWKSLSPEEQAVYEHRAKGRARYGKNIFVKEFMLDLL
jgi:hypothetical protein